MARVRCMNCMEEYNEKQNKCPHCGYMYVQPIETSNYLLQETILQKRYIVGNVLRQNENEIIYVGWDQVLEKRIAIKEFFSTKCMERVKGQKELWCKSEEEKPQFLRELEQFISEAQQLARFREETGMLRIYDSFEENGTAYTIIEYTDNLRTVVVKQEPKNVDQWQKMKRFFYIGWGIGAVAIMVLLALLFFETREEADATTNETVPNIAGMTYQQAMKELEVLGVEIEKEKYCYSDTLDTDIITCQSISVGTPIEEGMVVCVVVTSSHKYDETQKEVIGEDEAEKDMEEETVTEEKTITEMATTGTTTTDTSVAPMPTEQTTQRTVKKTTQTTTEKVTKKKEKKTTEKKTEKKTEQKKTTEKITTEEVIVIEE